MTVAAKDRRAPRLGWIFAAVWLYYLVVAPVKALLAGPDGWAKTTGLVAVTAFAVLYLVMVRMMTGYRFAPERPRSFVVKAWLGLLAMIGLAALQVPGAGAAALACGVYIAASAMVSLPLMRQAIPFAVVLAVVTETLPHVVPGWTDDGYGLAVVLGSSATWGMRLAGERQRRLMAAQEELAELAVRNERARIASDLHDILGHSLTVVTVKAELAQRLLDVDLERARKELGDLERLARDALADVRSTALGMRGISLPGEIAAAREALEAANVEAELPGAADDVPTRFRELFAWTIREAVTNVVRHSGASHVRVLLGPASVEIVDDGVGRRGGPGGQGLAGLRHRAEELGAQLTVGDREDRPGFRVRVEVPT